MRVLEGEKRKKKCWIHLLESTLTLTLFDLHLSWGLEDPKTALASLDLAKEVFGSGLRRSKAEGGRLKSLKD